MITEILYTASVQTVCNPSYTDFRVFQSMKPMITESSYTATGLTVVPSESTLSLLLGLYNI